MLKKSLIIVGIFFTFCFADQWIGNDYSSIKVATVKAVRVNNNHNAWFSINENNTSIPADRIWQFDHTTTEGKNILAMLLHAKAAALPVCFVETGSGVTSGKYTIYNLNNLTVGGEL